MSDLPEDDDLVAVPDDSDLEPVADAPADEDLVAVDDGVAPLEIAPPAVERGLSNGMPGGDAPVELARSRLVSTPGAAPRRVAGRPGIVAGGVTPVAPSITGFTADDLSAEVRDTEGAQRTSELQTAFDSLAQSGGKSARALRVSKALGIKYEDALANLEDFEKAAKASANDPATFTKENPELARILKRRPEFTELVTATPDMSLAWKAFTELRKKLGRPDPKAAADFERGIRETEAQRDANRAATGEATLPKTTAVTDEEGGVVPVPSQSTVIADTLDQQKKFDEEQKKLEAPTKVTQLDDAKAKVGRSQGALMRQFYRAKEVVDQADVQEQGEKLMLAEVQYGVDSEQAADERGKYEDAKNAHIPRAYGDDTGFEHQVAIAVQGSYSTIAMGASSLKGAGIAGGAGLVLGGAAGYALEGPAGILPGAGMGAEALGGAGAKGGLNWGAFRMELQPTYEQNLALVTDGGKRMGPREAFGMAVVQSGIKAGLESFSFGVQTAALKGGAAELVKQVQGLAIKNPSFRAKLAELAIEWVKGGASEGVTGAMQSIVEQFGEYALKMGKDGEMQKFDVAGAAQRTVTDSEQELVGGLGFGGLTTVGAMAMHSAAQVGIKQSLEARSEYVTAQTGAVFQIAQTEGADLMAPELAEEVKRTTSETGAPLTAVHVPGAAIVKFFQRDEGTSDAQVDEAIAKELGPEGVAQVREAAASDSKVEIPLERVMASWGKSEVGKALLEETTTDPTALTPRELKERRAEIEAQAKEISEGVGAKMEAEEKATTVMGIIREEVLKANGDRREASGASLLFHHFWRVAGREFRKDPLELFNTFRVRFFRGDNLSPDVGTGVTAESLAAVPELADAAFPVVGEDAGAAVSEAFDSLSHEARASTLYTDKVSGLRTPRAWAMSKRVPGKVVAAITTVDTKPVNDNEYGGHDPANDLLRVIGGVIGGVDKEAAREGTTFLLHVTDQAELDSVLEAIRKKAPEGLAIDGGLATDNAAAEQSAKTILEKGIEDKRAAGVYAPREKVQTKLDLSKLATPGFRFSTENDALPGNVSDELMATVASGDANPGKYEGKAEFIQEAFYDKTMPGTMSREGFEAVGERDHVIAFDGIGLKGINDKFGKDAGNAFLAVIAQVAKDLGGEGVFFAHLSGDEFAAKSDNRGVLESFASDLSAALTDATIEWTAEDGTQYVITPQLRSGIGERTYGNADRALNAAKRTEAARGLVRGPSFRQGARDGGAVSGSRNLDAERRRAEARRGQQTDGSNRSGEADAEFDPEALSPGSTRPASKSEHTKEQMAAAREMVSRKRPANRARFNRFLDFVEYWSTGAQRPAGKLTRVEERDLAEEFGIVDPEVGFAVNAGVDFGKNEYAGMTKNVETTVAGKERQRDQRLAFEKNVLGRVNQASPLFQADEELRTTRKALEAKGLPTEQERPDRSDIDEQWLLEGPGAREEAPSTYLAKLESGEWAIVEIDNTNGDLKLKELSKNFNTAAGAADWFAREKRKKDPASKAKFDAYMEKSKRTIAAWKQLESETAGKGVSFRDSRDDAVLVTPTKGRTLGVGGETETHQWRVTWFSGEEPSGHAFADTHADALQKARDHGALPESAQTADKLTRLFQADNQQTGPKWFSQVDEAITSAKQDKNTGAAWWAYLQKAPGVKSEELEFLGIKEWLLSGKDANGQPVKSLTKSDLSEFMLHNRIDVTEQQLDQSKGPALEVATMVGAASREVYSDLEGKVPDDMLGDFDHFGRLMSKAENAYSEWIDTGDEQAKNNGWTTLNTAYTAEKRLRRAAGLSDDYSASRVAAVLQQIAEAETAERRGGGQTQYGSYKLGGEEPGSYRELLFYTPSAKGFSAPHFDSKGKGLLAHARVSIHKDASGERVLFVEEMQSDLHQQGRDKGYRVAELTPGDVETKRIEGANPYWETFDKRSGELITRHPGGMSEAEVRAEAMRYGPRQNDEAVPNAPFKQSWEELLAKRVVMLAAEQGIKKIGWTTGAQQADRYDLAKQVDAVMYQKNADSTFRLLVWLEGKRQILGENLTEAQLEAQVGKDVAKRIVADEGEKTNVMGNPTLSKTDEAWGHLSGDGLKIGGDGMKAAYDVRLPSVFKKLVKKDGGTIQQEKLQDQGPSTGDAGTQVWTATVPDSLLKSASEKGMPLFQPSDATEEKSAKDDASVPRGYYMPSVEQMQHFYDIFRNGKADITTLIHEMGHAFLDITQALAARADAPLRTRERWQEFLDWAGITDAQWSALDTDGKRVFHEKFAEGFEVYLRNGHAPSRALGQIFARFKLWITGVYATLKEQHREELDPKLKRIFDRMLATDEEIEKALGDRGPRLFDNAKDAGMTEEEWLDKKLEEQAEAGYATREAQLYAVKDAERETEQWWAEELRDAEKQAEAAYDALPAEQARVVLAGDEEAGLPTIILNREEVEAAIGRKAAKKLRTEWFGTSLAQAAQLAGFEGDGPALAKALLELPERKAWVAKQAQDAMEVKFPGVMQDRTKLAKMVNGGLHTLVEKRILEDWAAIRAKGPKPGMGKAVAPAEAIKRAAELMVEKRAVSSLDGSRVLAAERKAANEKAKAGVKGEFEKAQGAALRELLNAYLYREVLTAKEEVTALEERAAEMGGKKAQARLGKASKEYRDAVSFLLESLGLKKSNGEITADVLPRAINMMNGDGVIIGEPDWKTAIDGVLHADPVYVTGDRMAPLSMGRLTVKGMRAFSDALKGLEAAARARTTFLIDGKREEKEAVVAEALLAIEEHKDRKPPSATKGTETVGELIKNKLSSWDGFLRNPIDLVRELTADNQNSILWKVIVNPMRRAKFREAELLKKTVEPIVAAMEKMPKKMKATISEPIDGNALFPNHTRDFSAPRVRWELLVMALNAGNESNLQRLTEGRNITVPEVRAALDLLTKEEINWVQTVLDQAESLKPESFDLEERLTGIRPEAIKATPMELKNGRLRGGYFPAVYERTSQVGEKQAQGQLAQLMDPSYVRPGTPHGHLKSRVENVRAIISLSPGSIYTHLASVAHDVAFREVLQSVGSFVLDKRIDAALKQRLGEDKARQFFQWLKDVGGAASPASNPMIRTIQFVKSNMAPAVLGWRASTALGDFANLPTAIATTKLKTRFLANGIRATLTGFNAAREQALKLSPELRSMADNTRQQFNVALRDFTQSHGWKGLLNKGPMGWYRDHAFALMEAVSKVTATPVWLGAFNQALAEGMPEAAAARWADDILTQVFPSHSPVEQAGILRDKGMAGLSTVFYGYLSVAYRAQARILSDLTSSDFSESSTSQKAGTIASVSGRLLGFYVAYQVLGELLMGRGPEAGDDDDEEPENKALRWRNWFMRKLLTAPLQTMPVLGDAAPIIEAKMLGRRPRPREGILSSYLSAAAGALLDVPNPDVATSKKLEGLLRIIGGTFGIPISPAQNLKYLLDATLGDRSVATPFDFVSGAIYGEREDQPATPITAIGDAVMPK